MRLDTGREANRNFAVGLARAFGGAIIFALPLFMTMEMWWLGFYMNPASLILLLILILPVLIGLSFFTGFEETSSWVDDVVDAFVAYGVGFVAAALILGLFGVIGPGMPLDEITGKIALQAVPGSIGATTAGDLTVAGTLHAGERKVETSEITIDYLPPRSERRAGLFFTRDPRKLQLEIHATGYQEP